MQRPAAGAAYHLLVPFDTPRGNGIFQATHPRSVGHGAAHLTVVTDFLHQATVRHTPRDGSHQLDTSLSLFYGACHSACAIKGIFRYTCNAVYTILAMIVARCQAVLFRRSCHHTIRGQDMLISTAGMVPTHNRTHYRYHYYVISAMLCDRVACEEKYQS